MQDPIQKLPKVKRAGSTEPTWQEAQGSEFSIAKKKKKKKNFRVFVN
jgi:hypothetical protein